MLETRPHHTRNGAGPLALAVTNPRSGPPALLGSAIVTLSAARTVALADAAGRVLGWVVAKRVRPHS
ncbi:hypothetical protein SEA_JUANYO_64 [Microbacterium phage Juanyo]|nr:hypothetical protein SEA_JUANYO_64 [Microbacterium phage Juanyo]